ncbi:hypothetical protein BH09GEM1_BH09GEM1_32150 [soil metagenome]
MHYTLAVRTAVLAVVALLQGGPVIPPPRGLVNDFANVLSPAAAARIASIAQDVRDKTKGEIAVVTLADLGGRDKAEIALRIGREWKVGNLADIGDKSRNAGVVILVVPKETASDNAGRCRIEVGQGAEGYITDATAGEICREATPLFQQRDYSGAMELLTLRVAQRFAQEFNVALDTAFQSPVVRERRSQTVGGGSRGIPPWVLLVVLIVVLNLFRGGGRRRGGCFPWWLPFMGGFGGGGGGGGWGGGGFGGGGGGGFGGFGGGGGFSGGGGGSNW